MQTLPQFLPVHAVKDCSAGCISCVCSMPVDLVRCNLGRPLVTSKHLDVCLWRVHTLLQKCVRAALFALFVWGEVCAYNGCALSRCSPTVHALLQEHDSVNLSAVQGVGTVRMAVPRMPAAAAE
jgi:hypothetical protein